MQNGGEKELILGNKQLISLFFVVVALCGVFFAMGYMVRGNSLKGSVSATTDAGSAASPESVKRQQPEPPAETTDVVPATTQPAATAPPPVETRPAQDTAAAGASTDSITVPRSVTATEAGAFYIQVGALARADAEATVRTLREQHLPALVAASSKENLFRVLVGPYRLTADVADAKTKLKTLGFAETIVQKQ